ncbi:HalOD1 output domain-containing protein [Natronobacterium haloterrestre]|uniref:HalOD1 output domain-containing protein n=1 Tax=Natronobacterium haloterrestre TaxID=148448 RepID=UPI0015A68BE8|nr:HalOD1 output domain-containing protein [Halobiforma haloterrestris]
MSCDDCRTAWDRNTSISSRVVQEVADILGVDPLELDPLFETINPDALDSLFQTRKLGHRDGHVEFMMEGCKVTVFGTGRVDVTPPAEVEMGSTNDQKSPVTGHSEESSSADG